jgi:hypothetical protein
MVLMNGSKKARLQDSVMNRTNTDGGNKKSGIPSLVGRPSNVYSAITNRCFPAVGFFPFAKYGSTVKGTVGMKYPYM